MGCLLGAASQHAITGAWVRRSRSAAFSSPARVVRGSWRVTTTVTATVEATVPDGVCDGGEENSNHRVLRVARCSGGDGGRLAEGARAAESRPAAVAVTMMMTMLQPYP